MTLTDLAAAIAYGGTIVAAGLTVLAEVRRRRSALRLARHLLIAWVLGATLLAGIGQRDLWPLSSWSLMTRAPRRDMGVSPVYLRLLLVDGAGREYPLDYRSAEPFAVEELMAWMRGHFMRLPPPGRDSAAAFLLMRADAARARVRDGKSPGTQGRVLGPLRAPFHLLHPRQWNDEMDVPATPFAALRVYGETWDLLERAEGPSRVTRVLHYEFRAP